MSCVEKVEESSTGTTGVCPQCLGTPTDPRLLSCLHSLCRECVDQLLVTATERCVSCPVCRTETTVPGESTSSLPKDVTRRPSGPETCSSCGKEGMSEVPTTWCDKCRAAFCTSHAVPHMVSSGHTMGPLLNNGGGRSAGSSDMNLYCSEHGEHLKYVCEKCDELVCGACVIEGVHVDHKPIVSAKIVNEKRKEEVTAKVAKLRSDILPQKEQSLKALSDLKDKFCARADQARADIQSAGESVIRTVETLVQQRLQEVEDVGSARCKVWDGKKEELERDVDAVRRALDFSDKVLEKADQGVAGELYSVLPCVSARLSAMESSGCEKFIQGHAQVRFEACYKETLEVDLGRLLGVVNPCETSAKHCVVVDQPQTVGICGHPVAFVIEMKDVCGHTANCDESDIKAVWCKLPANVEEAPALCVEDKGEGRREVSWTPKECGEHVAEVSINGEKLPKMLSSVCQAWTFDPGICQPELELSENSCVVTHSATERLSFVVGLCVMTHGVHSWTVRVNNPSKCAQDLLIGVATKKDAETNRNDKDGLWKLAHYWNNCSVVYREGQAVYTRMPMMQNDDHIRLKLDCNRHTLRITNLRTECDGEITGLPDEELVPYFCLFYEGSSFRLIG